MKNKFSRAGFVLLFSGLIATSVRADTVELVTYYPTVSDGQFEQAHSKRSTVGTPYSPDTIADVPDGTLLVSGKVGIGTTTPRFPFDVYQNEDEAYLRVMGVGNGLSPENFSGLEFSADLPVNGVADYIWQLAHKRGGAGGENDFQIASYDPLIPAWSVRMAIRKNGNVGIGIALPDEKLQVDGNIRMPNTFVNASGVASAGVIYSDTTRFIHNFGPNNTFVGVESGNFTTTGTGFNSGYGQRSLMNLTSGFFNAAVGAGSLTSNTAGSDNTAVGVSALTSNSTGNNNVAVGYQALLSNISGSNNVAVGTQAGGNATGNQNVFIGVQAGLSETGDNKLYIENSSSPDPLIYGDFANDLVRINSRLGIGTSVTGAGTNVLAIANGIAPTSSPAGQIQLYAQGASPASELMVRDGSGFTTLLSPHNFSLIPSGASEPLAWAFYSERAGHAINIDMLRAIRVLENLSGEQLVHLKNLQTGKNENSGVVTPTVPAMQKELEQLKADNQKLQKQVDDLKKSVDALTRNSRR